MGIEKIIINDTEIYLEDLKPNQGKITITNPNGRNYSMWWGAMGGTIKDFIASINKEYFASKLLGEKRGVVMDVKQTFARLRECISSEMDLPWYNHQDFQKELRKELRAFQDDIVANPDPKYFVDRFIPGFVKRLPFFLIDNKHNMEEIERSFNNLTEVWNFIEEKESPELLWLYKLHQKLVKKLNSSTIKKTQSV